MCRKVFVFLTEVPVTQNDPLRFGFEIIQRYGWQLKIWDCTEVLYPHKTFIENIHIKNIKQIKVRNLGELKDLLNQLEPNQSLIYYRAPATPKLLKEIEKREIPYAVTLQNAWPIFPPIVKDDGLNLNIKLARSYSYLKKTIRFILKRNFKKIIQALFSVGKNALRKLMTFLSLNANKNNLVFEPSYIICGGLSCHKQKVWKINERNMVKAHTMDYDRFIEENISSTPYVFDINGQKFDLHKLGDFFLFIDAFEPFHPDYYRMEIKTESPESYYRSVNNFFEAIEKETGKRIVIAAHPRSDYVVRGNPYNNRLLFQAQTPKLVQWSQMVLIHNSTAMNFVILYNKPVIFFCTDYMDTNSDLKYYTTGFSKMFGVEYLVIRQNGSIKKPSDYLDVWKYQTQITNELRQTYFDSYIKYPNSPSQHSMQIFLERLQKDYAIPPL